MKEREKQILIIQSVKYGSAILQMELGEKLFMAVINWKKYGWEDKIILLRPRLLQSVRI